MISAVSRPTESSQTKIRPYCSCPSLASQKSSDAFAKLRRHSVTSVADIAKLATTTRSKRPFLKRPMPMGDARPSRRSTRGDDGTRRRVIVPSADRPTRTVRAPARRRARPLHEARLATDGVVGLRSADRATRSMPSEGSPIREARRAGSAPGPASGSAPAAATGRAWASEVGVGVGVGRSVDGGVGPAPRRSSARSCSRRRAASFAASIASDMLRVLRNDAKPWAMPAARPETFSTGVVITVETARTAVSALSAIETALSVTVSSLSSW